MNDFDHGVDLLLQRATDELRPDVSQLVASGVARGRARQRRARIGTAVATLAVFGVIGGGAIAVPHLGSSPTDSGADRGAPAATGSTAEPAVVEQIGSEVLVARTEMAATLEGLLAPGTVSAAGFWPDVDDTFQGGRVVYNDGEVSMFIDQSGLGSATAAGDGRLACLNAPGAVCEELTDGSWLATATYTEGDKVYTSVSAWTPAGINVIATARNTPTEKDSEPVGPEPVLAPEQLRAIVMSEVWLANSPSGEGTVRVLEPAGDAALTIAAADSPAKIAEMLPAGKLGPTRQEFPFPLVSEPDERLVHFMWDGTLTTFWIDSQAGTDCQQQAESEAEDLPEDMRPDFTTGPNSPWSVYDCTVRPDGAVQLAYEEKPNNGLLTRGVTIWKHGFEITLQSYNSDGEKEGTPSMDEPPIAMDDLVKVVESEMWFG